MPLKNKLFTMPLAAFLLCAASTSFAESFAVEGDLVFIADRGLVAKDLHTGHLNQCVAPPLLDPDGNDVTDLLSTATDVVIDHGYAIVAVHPEDSEGNPFIDTITVDVSNCFEDEVIPVNECISTVDMKKGLLIIPCVEIDGSVVTVHMDRRGKSSNWEVSFFQDNPNMRRYYNHHYFGDDHDHDHDHDYDDDYDDDHKHKNKNR